jgi:molecular chaperone HscB
MFAVLRAAISDTRKCSRFFRTSAYALFGKEDPCWSCNSKARVEAHPSDSLLCKDCGSIQEVQPTDFNYFEVFDIPAAFSINKVSLRHKFHHFQNLLHPDKFSNKSKRESEISAVTSSTVNQIYDVLSTPVERAKYLLKMQNINALEEGGGTLHNLELNTEIFIIREAIDDATSIDDLKRIRNDLDAKLEEVCSTLQKTYEGKNNEALTEAAIFLRYLSKSIEELDEKLFELQP